MDMKTDYLVIGAGALGMGFVDTLIENSDAEIVIVDRRHAPGGHWVDSYPFVQLHQPSMNYGVNSTPLGRGRVEMDGRDAGFFERASGPEICGYYDEIMRHRFLASGRVRFFPMCDYLGERRFRSRLTGVDTDESVRKSVVDATYMASRIPGTDGQPFEVADGANLRPDRRTPEGWGRPPGGYATTVSGKTAMDGVCWLIDNGTPNRGHPLDPTPRSMDPEPCLLPARRGSTHDVRRNRPGVGGGCRVQIDLPRVRSTRRSTG